MSKRYFTYHEVQDTAKLEDIKRSLQERGWIGMPLVRVGEEQLITGCHRYNAVKDLEWIEEGFVVPTIVIEDVFEEAGLDFNERWQAEGEPTIDEYGFRSLIESLPEDIKAKYGIDWH